MLGALPETHEMDQLQKPASTGSTVSAAHHPIEPHTSSSSNGRAVAPPDEGVEDAEKQRPAAADAGPNGYLTGWKLHCTTLGICLSLLLVNLEITIVGTSLVAITNDLQGFSETSWIVSGYLVTYMGFNIVWGKLSDMFGRKSIFITSMAFFTIWSAGCGASQTMNQLLVGLFFKFFLIFNFYFT